VVSVCRRRGVFTPIFLLTFRVVVGCFPRRGSGFQVWWQSADGRYGRGADCYWVPGFPRRPAAALSTRLILNADGQISCSAFDSSTSADSRLPAGLCVLNSDAGAAPHLPMPRGEGSDRTLKRLRGWIRHRRCRFPEMGAPAFLFWVQKFSIFPLAVGSKSALRRYARNLELRSSRFNGGLPARRFSWSRRGRCCKGGRRRRSGKIDFHGVARRAAGEI
jgi:hypothetical protein